MKSPGSLAVEVPDALDGHALVHAVGVGADLRCCNPSRESTSQRMFLGAMPNAGAREVHWLRCTDHVCLGLLDVLHLGGDLGLQVGLGIGNLRIAIP